MKRIIAIVLAIIGIASLVFVTSGVQPMALAKEDKVKKKAIEWVGQADFEAGWPMFAAVQRTCEKIAAASHGRLQLTVQPAGSFYPVTEVFDGVDEGVIDFAITHPAYWTDKFPAAELFSRPGGMSPMRRYLWFVSGGGAELAEQMIAAYDVHFIPGGMYYGTPALFLHSRYPVNEVADLVGLKMRALGSGAEILRRMGADAFSLPAGEIYEAMETEEIDAFEYTSPWVNWAMSLQEVADYVYVSDCRESHQWCHFIVNKTRWNELPDDLKAIVEEINNEETIRSYDEQCQLDIEALAKFRDYGCVVGTLSLEVEEAFLEVAKEYLDEMAAMDAFYAEVLQSLRAFEAIQSYAEQCQGM